MRLQDFVDVLGGLVAIPHALGVDHHVRAELAAVETARGVEAEPLDPQLPRLFTHITAQLLDASGLLGTADATAAGMALRPHIRAHEDVLLVKQRRIGGCNFHWPSSALWVRGGGKSNTPLFWL